MYISYEIGSEGRYTESEMHGLYESEVDHDEYGTFEDWKIDMLKSGVFEQEEKEMKIVTYNSKHDIYGNRMNLCVNHTTKEVYFYGCNCFNLGEVYNELGIREVNRMHKEFIADGFKPADHATVRDTWRSVEVK